MKRLIKIASLFLVGGAFLASCQTEEIVENPTIKVTDASDVIVIESSEAHQYTMDLTYYKYAASSATEVLAADFFYVSSNCAWKIVALDEESSWVTPYPDQGDKDGAFRFFASRNYDQVEGRQAAFQIVLNDGVKDIPVGGTIIISQSAAVDFIKLGAAKLEVNKEGGNASLSVTSNVDWTYELVPIEDYATPAAEEWVTDNTVLKYTDDSQTTLAVSNTLKLKCADNSNGSIRGLHVNIKSASHPELNQSIDLTQYGLDVEVTGFPVKWHAANNNFPNWASASNPTPTLVPYEGSGSITFHRADVSGIDRTASTCDVSGSNPRVNGVWEGDYWEFKANTAVSAGSLIKLVFEDRISGSGVRHWRLEYKDGTEWKIAGTELHATEAVSGRDITYTHDMTPGGSADDYNKVISQVVRYQTTTDEVAFRFYAASLEIGTSNTILSNPTTASTRLDYSGANGTEPEITCVASGGEIKYADIDVKGVSKGYLAFAGTNPTALSFVVNSSDDFTVYSDVDWLTVTPATGVMDEDVTVTVTCAESTLSNYREGTITVQAGVTKYNIPVIQSAAGQQLEPFISIVGGNTVDIDAEVTEVKLKVQTNVDAYKVVVPADVDWIATEPFTKAMVRVDELVIYTAANTVTEPRSATIQLVNDEKGLVVPVTVNQGAAAPSGETTIAWTFSAADMANYTEAFQTSNSFGSQKGKGYISFYFLDSNKSLDTAAKEGRFIGGTGEPYVTGVFPGDYWEFTLPAVTASAGATINFRGQTRCSATGQMYWAMQYNVGDGWEYVRATQTETVTGNNAVYTHAMASSNQEVNETIKLKKAIDKQEVKIRFTCVANWQVNGKGALAAPNGGTHRWSVDAGTTDGPVIMIKEPTPVLRAKWYFDTTPANDAYTDTFGGTAGVFKNTAGDNGFYIDANAKSVGTGRITYVQVDKTAIAPDTNPKYIVGGTGHPYMTGAWPGDYWYFTATDGNEYPAGTKLHVLYMTRISGTGQKYWKLEYWDGAEWQPTSELQTEGDTGTNAQYNFIEPTANATVDVTFTLAKACTTMQFRQVCVANWQSNGKGALAAPNGGTVRLAADAADLDGTSPVFEVVE